MKIPHPDLLSLTFVVSHYFGRLAFCAMLFLLFLLWLRGLSRAGHGHLALDEELHSKARLARM